MSGKTDATFSSSGTPSRYRVEVRLSAEERAHLETLAQRAGMSLSRYVRYACFETAMPPVVTDVAIATYEELGKLGENLILLDSADPELLNELRALLHRIRAEIAGICSMESGVASSSVLNLPNLP